MNYIELLETIAGRLYMPLETVRLMYDTMADIVQEEVRKGESVQMRRIGTVAPAVYPGGRLTNGLPVPIVKIRPSLELKAVAKEINMEKLGVKTDEEKQKTASEQKTCPECGGALRTDTNVPTCSKCGTKPFEAKE